MVYPVTGPINTYEYLNSPPTPSGAVSIWYDRKTSSQRQKKPYDLPLPYSMDIRSLSNWRSSDPSIRFGVADIWISLDSGWGADLNPASVDAFNKAYQKFMGALRPMQSEMGAAIGERKEALHMIAQRSVQLYSFANALRRFRFGEAANALVPRELKPLKGKKFIGRFRYKTAVRQRYELQVFKERRKATLSRLAKNAPKSFADAFLEFSFGWAPLVGDVSNAMRALTAGLPAFRVHGAGTVSRKYSKSGDDISWSSSQSISARLRSFDPNLALANQLGLVNPAYVAWELVPFSFVLDYFVNVGDYLNGFTDLLGYDLSETNWTWKATAKVESLRTWSGGYAAWSSERVLLSRAVGTLSGPQLAIRPRWTLSPQRAATSVSLLLQALRRKS